MKVTEVTEIDSNILYWDSFMGLTPEPLGKNSCKRKVQFSLFYFLTFFFRKTFVKKVWHVAFDRKSSFFGWTLKGNLISIFACLLRVPEVSEDKDVLEIFFFWGNQFNNNSNLFCFHLHSPFMDTFSTMQWGKWMFNLMWQRNLSFTSFLVLLLVGLKPSCQTSFTCVFTVFHWWFLTYLGIIP